MNRSTLTTLTLAAAIASAAFAALADGRTISSQVSVFADDFTPTTTRAEVRAEVREALKQEHELVPTEADSGGRDELDATPGTSTRDRASVKAEARRAARRNASAYPGYPRNW